MRNLMYAGIMVILALAGNGRVVNAQETESDWSFSASVGWAWRDIDGSMFRLSQPLSGAATADSLGLGSSSEPQAAFGVRWKQLTVQLVYMPSEFEGDGLLVQVLDFGTGPVIGTTTPITSNIDVAMMLANIEYDLLKRDDMDWGVGVGFGRTDLDVGLIPDTGPTATISGDVPFGYLTTTFTKRWDEFSAMVGVQGVSVAMNGRSVTYKSFNLAGGYKVHSGTRQNLTVLAGYRYVSFLYDFDDDATGSRTNTDFELSGPYVGLHLAW